LGRGGRRGPPDRSQYGTGGDAEVRAKQKALSDTSAPGTIEARVSIGVLTPCLPLRVEVWCADRRKPLIFVNQGL
jgi:hypothetical protein